MKCCKILCCLIASSILSIARGQDKGHHEEYDPSPYHYEYKVHDDKEYLDFGAQEEGDGNGEVHGEYHVKLPDGRLQHVSYKVDDYNGYIADVSYDGQAEHPSYHGNRGHEGSHRREHRFGKTLGHIEAENSFSDGAEGRTLSEPITQETKDNSFSNRFTQSRLGKTFGQAVSHPRFSDGSFSRHGKSGSQEIERHPSNLFGSSSNPTPVIHVDSPKPNKIIKAAESQPSPSNGFSRNSERFNSGFFTPVKPSGLTKSSETGKPLNSFDFSKSSGFFSSRSENPSFVAQQPVASGFTKSSFNRHGKSEIEKHVSNFFGSSSHSTPVLQVDPPKEKNDNKAIEGRKTFTSRFGAPKTNDFFHTIGTLERKRVEQAKISGSSGAIIQGSNHALKSKGLSGRSDTFGSRSVSPVKTIGIFSNGFDKPKNSGPFSSRSKEPVKPSGIFKHTDTFGKVFDNPVKSPEFSKLTGVFNKGFDKPLKDTRLPESSGTFSSRSGEPSFPVNQPAKFSVSLEAFSQGFSQSSNSNDFSGGSTTLGSGSVGSVQSSGFSKPTGTFSSRFDKTRKASGITKTSGSVSSRSEKPSFPVRQQFASNSHLKSISASNEISQTEPTQGAPRFKGHPIGFSNDHPVLSTFKRHPPVGSSGSKGSVVHQATVGHQGSFGRQVSKQSSGPSKNLDTQSTVVLNTQGQKPSNSGHRSFITHKAIPV